MKRSEFIKSLAIMPLATASMKLSALHQLTKEKTTATMPILFVGHGSPMNAIEENEFVQNWRKIGASLPTPSAILCISAHWETKGTFVTAMEQPKTIHDFGGFPQALFDVQYPAPGSKQIAELTKETVNITNIGLDHSWGLDHGAWSILKPMFPKADIPVLQLSLDYTKPPQYHYDLAKELSILRNKGVLIIGSGNMVHNLGKIAWNKINEPAFGFDWAISANQLFKDHIINHRHQELINYTSLGKDIALSVPSPDHYLPLLYTLALKNEKETISFFNDKTVMGSIAMTSFVTLAS